MNFNYQKIYIDLFKDSPKRTKDVISRRFGLKTPAKETLELIGKSYGISRERVRQIEKEGISKIKPKLKRHQETFQYFKDRLRVTGNLRKEDTLLQVLGGPNFQNHTLFLLTLEEDFERFSATKDFYSFWTIDSDSLILARKVIDSFYNKLTKLNSLLSLEDYNPPTTLFPPTHPKKETPTLRLTPEILLSYLEISKKIGQGPGKKFGLRDWPEINPKGVKDWAYLVLKKDKKPLHFRKITDLINNLRFENKVSSSALPQTIHNELIRDPRFVLVGRGLYALREWGYTPGQVGDIILKVLKEAGKPLAKEQILKEVLNQRLVKENTVLLNLQNKKYFLKDSQGKYTLK